MAKSWSPLHPERHASASISFSPHWIFANRLSKALDGFRILLAIVVSRPLSFTA